MKRSANVFKHKSFVTVAIDTLEKRLVFVKRTMEWFHQHGVNVEMVEKHLRILDITVQCIKESKSANMNLFKEEHERRKKEVWELLSKFSGMVVHQKTLTVVAFELVGDIDKFDDDTLQVVGRVREIEEEENEEDSEEEDEDEDEVCSEYVSPFWEELKGMFLPIQHSLG